MRISLIGYRGNSVNIFPELIKSLSKKISGLEVSVRFVPFFEDIPIVCVEEASSSDFLVVFALLDEKSEIDFLKDKLVDVELLTKTRILKWVEEDSFSSKLTQDYFDQRDALVEDLSGTILSILFKENDFVPVEDDYY
ncbi:MAG: hypothetical protein ACOX1V_04470 [Candidatus Iainarchaeum sp.]|jgi:hypothetical protein|nr:MAG: hypothetical protein BWY55_00387 [archaeon ADurb.Bin336]